MIDALRIAVRAAHLIAATAWIGGALFYAVALRPHVTDGLGEVNQTFRALVRLCVWTLLITGAILTFDRLSDPRVSTSYVVTLAVKVALSFWLFYLAGVLARRRSRRRIAPPDRASLSGRNAPIEAGERAGVTTEPRPGYPPERGTQPARTILGIRIATPDLILGVGLVVFVLGATLVVLYERALALR